MEEHAENGRCPWLDRDCYISREVKIMMRCGEEKESKNFIRRNNDALVVSGQCSRILIDVRTHDLSTGKGRCVCYNDDVSDAMSGLVTCVQCDVISCHVMCLVWVSLR